MDCYAQFRVPKVSKSARACHRIKLENCTLINYQSSSEANKKKKNLQLKNGEKVTEIQCYSAANYICIATRKFTEN